MSRITGASRVVKGALGVNIAQGDGNQSPRGTNGSRYRKACGFLISAGAFVVALGAACTDKDNTAIDSPDSGVSNGGSGGSSGAGGSGATGGSAGTASAGASGTGGDQPDASAGSGGSGGSGGSAGDDAGTDAGFDGGPTSDAGDAAPVVLTEADLVAAFCQHLNDVDTCSDFPDCNPTFSGQWDFLVQTYPNCSSIIHDYFACMGTEPETSYYCDSDTPYATTPQTGNCAAQDTAFQAVNGGTDPCTQ